MSDIHWVLIGRGRLALWHKPGRRAIPGLKRHGCEHVVTLLSAREGAEEVGQAVRNAGMDWSWIPLASGRPPQGRQNGPIVEALPRLSAELMIAAFLGLVSAALVWRPDARPVSAGAGIVIGSVWPFLGLRFLGWPGVAVGFALTIVTLAVGCQPRALRPSPSLSVPLRPS